MKTVEKTLAKNLFVSHVLALQEWYFSLMQGNLRQLEKKHYNELMKPLDKYLNRLNKNLDEGAEGYLEMNKDYFIGVLQSMYDEQIKILTNESE